MLFTRSVYRSNGTSQLVRWTTSRTASTEASNKSTFSDTLLLPTTRLVLRNAPHRDENIRLRTCEGLYKWQWNNAKGPLFVFHDGPPYANGDLHMGHALNKILKDIINRYQVLLGRRVHYVPGWDCHGLPIENKVLKELKKDIHEVSSAALRMEADKYAKDQAQSQMAQLKQLGIMSAWSPETTYRTLDHDYELRQLRIFQRMVEKGLIYRHHRPVHYSPSSRSALAEAELEYKDDHISHSIFVSFSLDTEIREGLSQALQELASQHRQIQLLVWTTTPWTLTANMGIAVNSDMAYTVMAKKDHPEDGVFVYASERQPAIQSVLDDLGLDTICGHIQGSDLVNASYRPIFAPLQPQCSSLPVIHSSHVTADSGTGIVHCAPAHGHDDYLAFRNLGLLKSPSSLLCHVDGLGKFTSRVTEVMGQSGERFIGQEVLADGNRTMVNLLKELNVIQKVWRMKHRYPYDWKTDKPVIIMATSQWFANLDAIKDDAINALQDVQFFPPQSQNRLQSFVKSRSEWCISRQRSWGVPIPALYHRPTNRAFLDSASLSHILSVLQERGTRYWWDGPVEDFVPPSLRVDGEDVNEAWEKGTDTMDVWFDSGTSWSMLEGLDGQGEGRSHLANVCLEGSDQHRGWFQSQLLTAVGSAGTGMKDVAPYGTLITHGMVLDEKGKKMSKSLGNIVSPMTVVNGGQNIRKEPAYGTDVLRLWAASVEFGRDMSIGPTVLSQCAESYRKIRNASRFILGNLRDRRQPESERVSYEQLPMIERYVLHKLYHLDAVAREGYTTFNFAKVVTELSNFANVTLSSLYHDITKDRLYCQPADSFERRVIVTTMQHVLDSLVTIMAPILPHTAEEIHQTWYEEGASVPSVFTQPWKTLPSEWHNEASESDMSALLQVRGAVLKALEMARRMHYIASSMEAHVELFVPDNTRHGDLLRREESSLPQLFIVSGVTLSSRSSALPKVEDVMIKASWSPSGSESEADPDAILVKVGRPVDLKCPRCWSYTRPKEDTLCRRCSDAIAT
ncbi:tRNA synthetases class I-domain-containing protein [Cytidiella melzeri]|nr:tRNA synthetases class I-domain-containing protein [Cytidiella melzeri]